MSKEANKNDFLFPTFCIFTDNPADLIEILTFEIKESIDKSI